MEQLRKAWIWFCMLTKRLYKKPSFLLILLMIPLLVFAYGRVAQEESGILTVALVQSDPADPLSGEIIDGLVQSSPLIRYKVVDSVEQAHEQVRMGAADSAWIFPADMEQKILEFVCSETEGKPFVQVITRENSVSILLSNELLSGIIFRECARSYYVHDLRQNAEELAVYTDEELLQFYDEALIGDQLFSFTNTDGESDSATDNYLLMPLRGILGVLIVLCGLATAMYYVHDLESGLFSYLSAEKRLLAEFGYQLVSVVNISVVAFSCLLLLGLFEDLWKELLSFALYTMCVTAFCMMVRCVCSSLRSLGTAMVLLVVLMIAICPVFYDLSALWKVQHLLPPTYFVNGVYNVKYLYYAPVFTSICFAIPVCLRLWVKR